VEPIKDKVFPLQVYGLDANYKWKPFLQGDKHSFLLGGEFYLAPKEMSDKKIAYGLGGFGFAQYQFNQWLYLGVRYDYRHAFNDVGHAAGAFLTYYTTEFLRFRLGYEVVADIGFSNPKNNVMLEVNFVFGSHPVEPYWVNR